MFICSPFHYTYPGIPDLALEILNVQTPLCWSDVLQPEVYQFVPGMI